MTQFEIHHKIKQVKINDQHSVTISRRHAINSLSPVKEIYSFKLKCLEWRGPLHRNVFN